MRGSRSSVMRRARRSEEHTSELQSRVDLVCRLLLEKKKCRQTGPAATKASAPSVNSSDSSLFSPSWFINRLTKSVDSATICFFFNDTATAEIYTLSLHDALPIFRAPPESAAPDQVVQGAPGPREHQDRKSTRLNSSHEWISYAVFCLKKKKK